MFRTVEPTNSSIAVRGERLRVATWNCFGVPGGVVGWLTNRPHMPQRFRSERLALALAPFDIVCIQEVFSRSVLRAFEEMADRLEMYFWHDRLAQHVIEKTPFGGGLAFLSRQPFDARAEIFKQAAGVDAFAAKGYSTCELSLASGASVRVVNLHLQANDPRHAPHVYGEARASQIAALIEGLERHDHHLPTIVCGDLNVVEGSDEYHHVLLPYMRRCGFIDIAEGLELHTYAPKRNAWLAAINPEAFDARLDYIWVSDGDGLSWRVTSPPQLLLEYPLAHDEGLAWPVFASDHFGIGVELELG